jgi:hypothetical protein
MKIILATMGYSKKRAEAAVAFASAHLNESPCLVVVTNEIPGEEALPSSEPDRPTLRLSECYTSQGVFKPVTLLNWIDSIPMNELHTLILDGSMSTVRILDSHGNRTGEVIYNVMKRFFWNGPKPQLIVHFVPDSLIEYYARDWGKVLCYPPIGSHPGCTSDAGMDRVIHMQKEAQIFWRQHHPFYRFKSRLVASLKKLVVFWK